MKITHAGPIALRFSEIDNYLALLAGSYGTLSFAQFHASPAAFGGTARFIQMIAKHTIEIASQLAFDNGLAWQNYTELFAQLSSAGALDAKTDAALLQLSNYYLPETMMQIKLKDIYEARQTVPGLIAGFKRQLSALPGWRS